jgi:hypothetical protein
MIFCFSITATWGTYNFLCVESDSECIVYFADKGKWGDVLVLVQDDDEGVTYDFVDVLLLSL